MAGSDVKIYCANNCGREISFFHAIVDGEKWCIYCHDAKQLKDETGTSFAFILSRAIVKRLSAWNVDAPSKRALEIHRTAIRTIFHAEWMVSCDWCPAERREKMWRKIEEATNMKLHEE